MYKPFNLAVLSALLANGFSAFAKPIDLEERSLVARGDGDKFAWNCDGSDWCKRLQCGANQALDPFWPDWSYLAADAMNEVGTQISNCCKSTLGNKWLGLGPPQKCEFTVGGSVPTKVTLTAEVTIGGFNLNEVTCSNAFAAILFHCYMGKTGGGNMRIFGGCNTSSDGNFKTCIWPHCNGLNC